MDRIWVEQNSNGNVWVRFAKEGGVNAAKKAQPALHGRYIKVLNMYRFYAGKQINATFVPESVFNSKVSGK